MVGTASAFLKFNIDGSMMQILALEDHLRRTSPRYESEEASCLVKHILQLNEQSLEGISHAAEVGDKDKVQVFRDLQKGAEHLREQLRKRVDPLKLIREVRALRKRAEALDPSFNLEKCKSCGNIEDYETLMEATHSGSSLADAEEKNAYHVLDQFSKREGVDPPKLVIDPSCSDPNKGVYDRGTIKVCKGAVSNHVLFHEAFHHLQYLRGEPLNEDEAEKYAINFAEHTPHNSKGLNLHESKEYGRGKFRMQSKLKTKWPIKSLIAIEVVGAAAAAIEPLNDYVDVTYPNGFLGQKASTLVDLAGAVGFGVGALYMKVGKATIPMAVASSFFVNDWVRKNVIPMILPAARVGGVRYAATRVTQNNSTSIGRTVRMTPNGTPYPSPSVVRSKYDIVTA